MSEFLVSTSPADPGDELGRFPVAGGAEIDAAVDRARRAFPAWRDAGLEARAAVLRRFANLAAQRAPELALRIARDRTVADFLLTQSRSKLRDETVFGLYSDRVHVDLHEKMHAAT